MRLMVAVEDLAARTSSIHSQSSQPRIFYDIKLLRRARLVEVGQSGKYDFYTAPLDEVGGCSQGCQRGSSPVRSRGTSPGAGGPGVRGGDRAMAAPGPRALPAGTHTSVPRT